VRKLTEGPALEGGGWPPSVLQADLVAHEGAVRLKAVSGAAADMDQDGGRRHGMAVFCWSSRNGRASAQVAWRATAWLCQTIERTGVERCR
jgi:hypothetical protein